MQAATPLPDGPLEWIETDGVAYIDTGVAGGQPKSVKFTAQIGNPNVSFCLMGAYYGSSTKSRRFIFGRYVTGEMKIHAYFHSSGNISVSCVDSATNNTPFDVETILNRNKQTISIKEQGGEWVTASGTNGNNSSGTASILILAAHGDNGIEWQAPQGTKIMTAKIYDDVSFSSLLRNYLPWRLNGEVGLMDTLTNTFYGNAAGSGAFTGGPNVI